MLSRRSFLGAAAGASWPATAAGPLRFAVLADVQYADKDTAGKREYRRSLDKLRAAVDQVLAEKPEFTIHLGDLVDEGAGNAGRVFPLYRQMPGREYLVLGNHDFFGPRQQVLRQFGLKRSYYAFRRRGWQLVVLDGMAVSVKGGWAAESVPYQTAQTLLAGMKQRGERNAHEWNGAVGDEQRAWLTDVLRTATQRGERTIVFCHFPALAEACRPDHLLWDHAQVLAVLESAPTVAAYFCGHDHNGGYALRKGIHHITMAGVVEHGLESCLRIVEAGARRLVLRAPGAQEGQNLEVAPRV